MQHIREYIDRIRQGWSNNKCPDHNTLSRCAPNGRDDIEYQITYDGEKVLTVWAGSQGEAILIAIRKLRKTGKLYAVALFKAVPC